MTFIAKLQVAAPPRCRRTTLGFTRRYVHWAQPLSTLCAGCGHDSINAAIVIELGSVRSKPQNMVKLQAKAGPPDQTAVNAKTAYFGSGGHSSIPCHGRMPRSPWGANAGQPQPAVHRRFRRPAIPCP